jgi:hypothetical protein
MELAVRRVDAAGHATAPWLVVLAASPHNAVMRDTCAGHAGWTATWALGLVAMAHLGACGLDTQPMIAKTAPLNGSTAIDVATHPTVEAARGASIDGQNRKIVLYDVTAGARKTVAAEIEIVGTTVTYKPAEPLPSDHSFELVFEQGSITGPALDELDGSEQPTEALSWPYRLWFSTSGRPRVRAAYLTVGVPQFITVCFSQPMEPLSTAQAIQVLDLGGTPIATKAPVWIDEQRLRVDVAQQLDLATPYRLRVSGEARSRTDQALDGNDDGTGGDEFSRGFTGSQPVIFSRLRK